MSSELRIKINDELKIAMKNKEATATATIRLIAAALKDRDISSRSKGDSEGIDDKEILSLLQTMIKQRQESMRIYEEGGRKELADREEEEIAIIQKFLPKQLNEKETERAVVQIIEKIDAKSVKDMGKIMAELKESYTGQMDFSVASQIVKQKLINQS